MPQYEYSIRDSLGKAHIGQIEAETKEFVVDRLRQSGYFVTKVELKNKSTNQNLELLFDRVSARDMAIFFRQFSTLLASGMPLLRVLSVLSQQTEKKKLQQAIDGIRRDVETGSSLSQAVNRYVDIFPPFVVAMIRTGETGGVLDLIMERLVGYFENEDEVQSKIKAALRYPIIVFSFSILVVIFMLTFIIPKFMVLFDGMNIQMPLPTRIILGLSSFLQNDFLLIIVILVSLGAFVVWYKKTPEGSYQFDKIILKLPVFGNLVQKSSIAKLSRSLGTLLASGVPIIQALDITQDIADNQVIGKALASAMTTVREGDTLSRKLAESPYFPPMMTNMLSVGEETGGMEEMLYKIADFYDKEVKNITENMTALIEPFMISFLGVIIGGILLSILLPMFDVYANVGKGM